MKSEAKQRRQASNRCIGAADVEEALVLPGKARRRQVLGGGRAADGDRDVRAVFRLRAADRRPRSGCRSSSRPVAS